jgi:hypothetical protein
MAMLHRHWPFIVTPVDVAVFLPHQVYLGAKDENSGRRVLGRKLRHLLSPIKISIRASKDIQRAAEVWIQLAPRKRIARTASPDATKMLLGRYRIYQYREGAAAHLIDTLGR